MPPNIHNVWLKLIEKAPAILFSVAVLILAYDVKPEDIPKVVEYVVHDGFLKFLTLAIALLLGAASVMAVIIWSKTKK